MTPPPRAPRPLRVCVLGGDLVAGVGDPTGLGWTGHVAARLAPVPLLALGIPGESAAGLGDRWRRELRPRLPPRVRGAVVLAGGSHDARPARAAPAVLTAARGIRARHHAVLVLGPAPDADPARDAALAELDAALTAGCAHHGIASVSVRAALLADGRWTAGGAGAHAAYADAVWEGGWLAGLLPSTGD